MLNNANSRFTRMTLFSISPENIDVFRIVAVAGKSAGLFHYAEGVGFDGQIEEPIFIAPHEEMGPFALMGLLDDQEYVLDLLPQAPSSQGRRPVEKVFVTGTVVPLGCMTAVSEADALGNGAWTRFDDQDGKPGYWVAKSADGTDGCASIAPEPEPVVNADAEVFACGWSKEAYANVNAAIDVAADVASPQPAKTAVDATGHEWGPSSPVTAKPAPRTTGCGFDTADGSDGSNGGPAIEPEPEAGFAPTSGEGEIDLLDALTGVFGRPTQISEGIVMFGDTEGFEDFTNYDDDGDDLGDLRFIPEVEPKAFGADIPMFQQPVNAGCGGRRETVEPVNPAVNEPVIGSVVFGDTTAIPDPAAPGSVETRLKLLEGYVAELLAEVDILTRTLKATHYGAYHFTKHHPANDDTGRNIG